MGAVDCLVVADRVLVLKGSGPWVLASDPRARADLLLEPATSPRRVRVRRQGDHLELEDMNGEGLFLRGERRTRHEARCDDAVAIGRSQVLLASLVEGCTVRWQGMLATAAASLLQLADIARAVGSSAPVFIGGESGTGKELAAHAAHAGGARSSKPFIALNCAALPETLAESELFGVERGAYTGAMRSRPGAFVQAHGGTLFLDEIGELSPMIQAKLLRALEVGEVQPVGGARTITTDVRIVAASWRDLDEEADLGRFRHDLLHRLCVLRVDLLPLRERREDVLPLVRELLRQHDALDLAPDPVLARALTGAPWRGNVRELKNGVLRALAAHDPLALLPRQRKARSPDGLGARRAEEHHTHDMLASTLAQYRGNRKRSAVALGISRSTLYRWLDAESEARCSAQEARLQAGQRLSGLHGGRVDSPDATIMMAQASAQKT